MADNTTLPGVGEIMRTVDRAGVKTSIAVLDFGTPGAENLATALNPYPIATSAANFIFSTPNSSTAQLAASATFAGAIETALNQPCISLLLTSDQPITLTINQYIDVAGTFAAPAIVYQVPAGQGFSASFVLNGNYVKVSAQNTGAATTTTFNMNTAYGTIGSADAKGRTPVSFADGISLLSTTISAVGNTASVDTTGYAAVVFEVTGLWTGDAYFESCNDNVSWRPILVASSELIGLQDTITQGGLYTVLPSGRYVRLKTTVIFGSMVVGAIGRAVVGISAADTLSLAMDRQNNAPMQVQLLGHKVDAQGALIPADAPPSMHGSASVASSTQGVLTFETTGYQSIFAIGVAGGGTWGLWFSDDKSNWVAGFGFRQYNSGTFEAASQTTHAVGNPGSIHVTAYARWAQLRITTVSAAPCTVSVALRQLPVPNVPFAYTSNIAALNVTLGTLANEDSAAAPNPLVIGGVVRTAIAPNTLAAGDAARLTFSTSGAAIVEKHAVRELTWLYAAAASGIVNTTTAVTMKAAVAAQRGNLSAIQVMSEALGAATELVVRDGAAGTVMWRTKIPAGGLPTTTITFDPPLPQAAVNTLLEVATLTASLTGAVYVNAQGFMSN